MTTAVIDADMVQFHCHTKLEVDVELGDEMWTRFVDLNDVREEFWSTIDVIQEEVSDLRAGIQLCFTGNSEFRKRLDPAYKANRAGRKKPIGFKAFKQELLLNHNGFQHNEIEADDALGILATGLAKEGKEVVIVSGDKDLNQIPGHHYWPYKPEGERHWYVTPNEGLFNFYTQVLIGDSTDNIPGCKGCGKVSAEKIVREFDFQKPVECWEKIVSCFEAALKKESGHKLLNTEEFEIAKDSALLQARLVRILQHGDYDLKERKVTLWTPPTLNH